MRRIHFHIDTGIDDSFHGFILRMFLKLFHIIDQHPTPNIEWFIHGPPAFDVQCSVFDVSFCCDRAAMPSGSMWTSTSLTAGMASRILSFTSWAILCERRTVICGSTSTCMSTKY